MDEASWDICSPVLSCILFYEPQEYIGLLVHYGCPNLGWEMAIRRYIFFNGLGGWKSGIESQCLERTHVLYHLTAEGKRA